MNEDALWLK